MKKYLKRKDNIIITAIDVLDEMGIQGLTTKEIARRQGITEPAIYRQYTGKQDIVLTILRKYASFDEMIQNTIMEQHMDASQSLDYLIKAYAEYYENYPQITTVMFSFDVYRYQPETNELMMEIMKNRSEFMTMLMDKGQTAGTISKTLPPEELGEMIIGLIWSTTLQWKLADYGFSLKDKLVTKVEHILKP